MKEIEPMTDTQSTYRGLIFDLDGTLIDSAPDIAAAVNDYFRAQGWPEQETAYVERFIGNGPRRLLLDMMIELGLPQDDGLIDSAVKAYIHNYNQAPTRYTRFYDHVREDIAALHEAGFELGICTNKPHALTLKVLEMLDISRFFKAVVGADAVAACKPDPRHLFAVADRMQLARGDWAYIGDTTVDQATATAADVPFFAVPWGTGQRLDVATDQRLSRLLDLMAYRPERVEAN
jgi:phosphoglycolate phosphatase